MRTIEIIDQAFKRSALDKSAATRDRDFAVAPDKVTVDLSMQQMLYIANNKKTHVQPIFPLSCHKKSACNRIISPPPPPKCAHFVSQQSGLIRSRPQGSHTRVGGGGVRFAKTKGKLHRGGDCPLSPPREERRGGMQNDERARNVVPETPSRLNKSV